MDRLIICGSPRAYGRSAKLAKDLFEACIAEAPEDELALVPVSQVNIAGCTGCGLCKVLAEGPADEDVPAFAVEYDEAEFDGEDDGEELILTYTTTNSAGDEVPRRCSIDDDMTDVYELMDHADELYLVAPVYFGGAPSQLKALLDRLQPYYVATADQRAQAAAEGRPFRTATRPAILHVVGEGGDPHGITALVTSVKSAIACAGFKLETVFDWVGQVSEEGEVLGEPRILDPQTGSVVVPDQEDQDNAPADADYANYADQPWGQDVDQAEEAYEPKPELEAAYEEDDGYSLDFEPEEAPARPTLRFHDEQVEERGRKSAEAGKRGRTKGRGEKRTTKGGNQTNNRNPRKENQSKKRRSDSAKKNTGRPVSQGRSGARAAGAGAAGKGQGGKPAAKAGKKRG